MEKAKIVRIEVDKLFGMYSYSLVPNSDSNFILLYGDNGSGKTTILNILYHLLNPEPFSGHRYHIGNIPFLRFSVGFSNNSEISVSRKDIEIQDYSIEFPYKGRKLRYEWVFNEQPKRTIDSVYTKYCDFLSDLGLNSFFVSSDRRIYEDNEEERKIYNSRRRLNRVDEDDYNTKNADISLKDVIDNFNSWMHYYVFTLINEGNQSIDEHYLAIIQNYTNGQHTSVLDIKNKISEIKEKNKEFIEFGLSIDLFSQKLQRIVGKLSKDEIEKVGPALDSYLGSLELRLDALEPLLNKLKAFRSFISRMFKDKEIIINAYEGVSIVNRQGHKLDYQKLSSGEKQILYLFCRIITSSENSLLVLIDEPEISLNIKWQRLFLHAVKQLIGSNEVQVVIASHSIDLITPYKDSIATLISK